MTDRQKAALVAALRALADAFDEGDSTARASAASVGGPPAPPRRRRPAAVVAPRPDELAKADELTMRRALNLARKKGLFVP